MVVFRGTQTTKEWLEDATLFMEQLDGEEPEHGFALFFNRRVGTPSRLLVRRGLSARERLVMSVNPRELFL